MKKILQIAKNENRVVVTKDALLANKAKKQEITTISITKGPNTNIHSTILTPFMVNIFLDFLITNMYSKFYLYLTSFLK